MRYFILIKKRGASRYSGAIPAKKGVSLSKIRNNLRRNLSRNYSAKIVSEKQLKGMLVRIKKRYKRRR